MVAKIEGGTRRVTALELSDIAAALRIRMSTLLEEPLPALVAHRSTQDLDISDSRIDALLARLADEVEFVASLEVDELGLTGADLVDRMKIVPPSSQAQAEELASHARTLMGLQADDPIHRLADAVGELGLFAFSLNMGPDSADAGIILLRRGAVSLVNSYMKVGRRRLALAHELGHYLVADDYTVDWRVDDHAHDRIPMESRLDRFARALLLPGTALATHWRELTETHGERSAAILVASKFRVDMSTLAARLRELSLADGETATAVRAFRTTQADLIELDLHIPLEEMQLTTVPGRFARTVLRLVRDERISGERAVDLLLNTISEAELPDPRSRRPDEIWKFVS